MKYQNVDSAVISVRTLTVYAISFVVSLIYCIGVILIYPDEMWTGLLLMFLWVLVDPINTLVILLSYLLKIYRPMLLSFKQVFAEVLLFHVILTLHNYFPISILVCYLSPLISIIIVAIVSSLLNKIFRRCHVSPR